MLNSGRTAIRIRKEYCHARPQAIRGIQRPPRCHRCSPIADVEKNARALLATFFTKLDLVSREEFDIQSQVLQRTREKLKALEERVARLEGRD